MGKLPLYGVYMHLQTISGRVSEYIIVGILDTRNACRINVATAGGSNEVETHWPDCRASETLVWYGFGGAFLGVWGVHIW